MPVLPIFPHTIPGMSPFLSSFLLSIFPLSPPALGCFWRCQQNDGSREVLETLEELLPCLLCAPHRHNVSYLLIKIKTNILDFAVKAVRWLPGFLPPRLPGSCITYPSPVGGSSLPPESGNLALCKGYLHLTCPVILWRFNIWVTKFSFLRGKGICCVYYIILCSSSVVMKPVIPLQGNKSSLCSGLKQITTAPSSGQTLCWELTL